MEIFSFLCSCGSLANIYNFLPPLALYEGQKNAEFSLMYSVREKVFLIWAIGFQKTYFQGWRKT